MDVTRRPEFVEIVVETPLGNDANGHSLTGAMLDLSRVVMVERGQWSDERQDWEAVFVIDSGLRVYSRESYKEIQRRGSIRP